MRNKFPLNKYISLKSHPFLLLKCFRNHLAAVKLPYRSRTTPFTLPELATESLVNPTNHHRFVPMNPSKIGILSCHWWNEKPYIPPQKGQQTPIKTGCMVDLSSTWISPDVVTSLFPSTNLTQLDFRNTNIREKCAIHQPKLRKIKAFLWIYHCNTVKPVDFAGCTAGSFGSFWFPLHNEATRRNCRSPCWWVNFPRSAFTNQFHQPKPLRPRLKNAIGKTCQGRSQLATQRADNKKPASKLRPRFSLKWS